MGEGFVSDDAAVPRDCVKAEAVLRDPHVPLANAAPDDAIIFVILVGDQDTGGEEVCPVAGCCLYRFPIKLHEALPWLDVETDRDSTPRRDKLPRRLCLD